jgi:hypothetical protein
LVRATHNSWGPDSRGTMKHSCPKQKIIASEHMQLLKKR